jgi:DnaJ-class molecular chaperone
MEKPNHGKCPTCGGSGLYDHSCYPCEGSGQIFDHDDDGNEISYDCGTCGGSGVDPNCPTCGGTGSI